ncbi:hypothetical protein RRG08_037489 [Elysia crispata]|uniref:Uncharacterized protein n=1 Tax=Elysia crispata TaxID=231223 RepID=A0AAE1E7V1_9GAST|nr:hypothetical protein RRG08_037489 [Elysia crispata]
MLTGSRAGAVCSSVSSPSLPPPYLHTPLIPGQSPFTIMLLCAVDPSPPPTRSSRDTCREIRSNQARISHRHA